MPASSSAATSLRPRRSENSEHGTEATSAPTKAAAGSASTAAGARPLAMASTAPSAPPAETPTMPGSAIGLRNSACMLAPISASPAPTSAATTMRGRRMARMIWCWLPVASAAQGVGRPDALQQDASAHVRRNAGRADRRGANDARTSAPRTRPVRLMMASQPTTRLAVVAAPSRHAARLSYAITRPAAGSEWPTPARPDRWRR